ncbi:MAG: hypothetical protein LBR12_05345, partial [Opitutaceae bacterium]|nr:hypothetical protein [Opitutaceae bacterium]
MVELTRRVATEITLVRAMLVCLPDPDGLLAPALASAAARRGHATAAFPAGDDPARPLLDAFPDAIVACRAPAPAAAARLAAIARHLSARLVLLECEWEFPPRPAPPPPGVPGAVRIRHGRPAGDSPRGDIGFHERLLAEWASGGVPALPAAPLLHPTAADTLADVVIELLERDGVPAVCEWRGGGAPGARPRAGGGPPPGKEAAPPPPP